LKKIAAYPSIAAVEVDERFNYQFFRCGNPTELFWCWGYLRISIKNYPCKDVK
jgi:hypothetical protein